MKRTTLVLSLLTLLQFAMGQDQPNVVYILVDN